jgi:hypothetical protein
MKEDTPVSEYFPQFANPVVLDNVMSPNPSFKPAQNVVLVKHLLNFTSGLFYSVLPDFGIKQTGAYTGIHNPKDPHSDFLSLLKVGYHLQSFCFKKFMYNRVNTPVFRSVMNLARIVCRSDGLATVLQPVYSLCLLRSRVWLRLGYSWFYCRKD